MNLSYTHGISWFICSVDFRSHNNSECLIWDQSKSLELNDLIAKLLSGLLSSTNHKSLKYLCFSYLYCDMTPQRRRSAVRETQQRRPVLDNGSLDTCPQQLMGLWKPEPCYEINIRFYGDVDSRRPTWYGTRSRVNGQATNVLHGYQRLYKRPCREERRDSSLVIRPSWFISHS
jgi:hypothetical protein